MVRHVLLWMLALASPVVGAQVSPENNTGFWKACTKTAAYKELSSALTNTSKTADECAMSSRQQVIALEEQLKSLRQLLAETATKETELRNELTDLSAQLKTAKAAVPWAAGNVAVSGDNLEACGNNLRAALQAFGVNVTRKNYYWSGGNLGSCWVWGYCDSRTSSDNKRTVMIHTSCAAGSTLDGDRLTNLVQQHVQ